MKFGICNETWQGWEFGKTCDAIAAAGYDGVEIAPFTLRENPAELTESEALAAEKTARAAGLEVIGLHWLLVKPAGLHLTSADDSVRRKTVQFAQHLSRLCAAMGGKIMVWGSPKQRSFATNEAYADAMARGVEAIRAVCELAGPLGVTIAMEPLPASDTNFLTTAAETVKFIKAVDHHACRLHLDVRAMSHETTPIPQIIAECKKYLVHFHANDVNLRGPGFGEVKYEPIARALGDVDYQGYVSVEVFDYLPDPHSIATKSISYLRRIFDAAKMSNA